MHIDYCLNRVIETHLHKNFDLLDKDGDGFISLFDLSISLTDGSVPSSERWIVEALKDRISDIEDEQQLVRIQKRSTSESLLLDSL